jgi:hypothetical protein
LDFSELVTSLEELRGASILQERDLLRNLLESVPDVNLPFLVSVLAGSTPEPSKQVKPGVVKVAISRAYGLPIELVERTLREVGDLPGVAEALAERRLQKVIAPEEHDAKSVLDELQIILTPHKKNKKKKARLSNLLIAAPPASSRVVLEILIGQSSAYARKSVLLDYISQRFDVSLTMVRELVELKGWADSIELLLGSSKGIVGRSGDGKECWKGRAEEGDAQSKR